MPAALVPLMVLACWPRTAATSSGPRPGASPGSTAERGADAPEVQARIRRIFAVSRAELVLLLFVVFAMAVKLGQ